MRDERSVRSPMRALIKRKPGPEMVLGEVPEPEIGPTDVLIRVRRRAFAAPTFTSTIGMRGRGAGQAAARHRARVHGSRRARRTAVRGIASATRVGRRAHLVRHVSAVPNRAGAHLRTREIIGVDRDGAFAEYIAIPEYNVWRLDPAIPDEYRRGLRSARQRRAHRDGGRRQRQERRDHRRRLDRIDGDSGRARRRRGASIAIDVNPAKLELAQAPRRGRNVSCDAARSRRRNQAPDPRRRRGRLARDVGKRRGDRHGPADWCATAERRRCSGFRPTTSTSILAERIIFKGLTVLGINGRRMFETWYQTRRW